MIRKLLITTAILLLALPAAAASNYAVGFYLGYTPSLGGNLNSYSQMASFQSRNGIDGMNRSLSGFTTINIDRLLGGFAGMEAKGLFYDYFLVRLGANYFYSVWGGKGTTVFERAATYYLLDCEYTFQGYDIPLTVGLCIPFWKDMKISFSCGFAFAYADYENNFKSATYTTPFDYSGSFKGWALPLVILVEAEYFISPKLAVSSSLSYYKGSTDVIRDRTRSETAVPAIGSQVDFAKIDFTGYRISFGLSYYFNSI